MKKTVKRPECTDAQLVELARAAASVDDQKLVKLCGRALAGSRPSRRKCCALLAEARPFFALERARARKVKS